MFRKSLKEKQTEKERFNRFLEEFGIVENAELHPNSKFYRGNILSEKKILDKLIKCGIIGDNIFGRFMGKAYIRWRSFEHPDSYYAAYKFELVDKDKWRVYWFDRVGL